MFNRDWLSTSEIARRWSEETGESAEALERDLDAWISEFVAREPSQRLRSPGGDGDAASLPMGILGGRRLQREALEVYCEEKGQVRPDFWFADCVKADERDSPIPLIASADPVPHTGHEASSPATDRPALSVPGATPEPAGIPARLDPNLVWQASGEAPPAATVRIRTRVRALFPTGVGLPGRKTIWLAGSLALSLSLLPVGFVLGQNGNGRSETGPATAERDQVFTALVVSLRSELAAALGQIDNLGAALETSENEVERLTQDLLKARRALDEAKDASQPRAQTSELGNSSSAKPAAAEVTSLKAELAAAQQMIASLNTEAVSLAQQLAEGRKARATALEKIRAEAETTRQEMLLAAKTSKLKAALLDSALERIAELEATLRSHKSDAKGLADELEKARQGQKASN